MTPNPQPLPPASLGTLRRLLTISLITIAITLFAVEMVVRVVPLYPDRFFAYDRVFGWRHIPNFRGTYGYMTCLGEYRQSVTINGEGLHDTEHTYTSDRGTIRIWLAGDSLVAGFEVPFEQTFF